MQGREEAGTVRSVERALAIVELLGEHGELGLEELHYLSGLPKATASRLLKTLVDTGWLYRGLCDRRYRIASRRLFGDPQRRLLQGVVEQASPLLVELGERTGLAVDLALLDDDKLRVVENAIASSLRRRYPPNLPLIGLHPSLCHSALGKAFLGELDEAELLRIVQHHGLEPVALETLHDEAHDRGFGIRTEGHWEYSVRLPFLIRGVAMPLRLDGRVIGSIALHWPLDHCSVEEVSRHQLTRLEDTVLELQRLLARQAPQQR